MGKTFELKYGRGVREIDLPEIARVEVLGPAEAAPLANPAAELAKALGSPLDGKPLGRRPAPNTVAIAVPDKSRPFPTRELLPVLLDDIFTAWPSLEPEQVTVIVGGGLHPPMGKDELDDFTPADAARGCKRIAHDARVSAMVDLGKTSRGTPVRINKIFASADFKVVMGQVDPHQFVGFTGGSKGAVIGCGAAETIEANHSLMSEDGASVGLIEGNPVREDMSEAGDMLEIDLAANAVMDGANRPVRVFAGAPRAALAAAAVVCERIHGKSIPERFDLAVASCGGYPKDISLYQAQKGLNLASMAVKPGGRILLLAECSEGVGDDDYFGYATRFATARDVLEDFERMGFKMGAHKAFLVCRTVESHQVVIDSELDDATLGRCCLTKADARSILNEWLSGPGEPPKVAIIPNANTTYFRVGT